MLFKRKINSSLTQTTNHTTTSADSSDFYVYDYYEDSTFSFYELPSKEIKLFSKPKPSRFTPRKSKKEVFNLDEKLRSYSSKCFMKWKPNRG